MNKSKHTIANCQFNLWKPESNKSFSSFSLVSFVTKQMIKNNEVWGKFSTFNLKKDAV